jgi:hypothetical protein
MSAGIGSLVESSALRALQPYRVAAQVELGSNITIYGCSTGGSALIAPLLAAASWVRVLA